MGPWSIYKVRTVDMDTTGIIFYCVWVRQILFMKLFYLSTSPSDPKDPYKVTEETRSLGLVVCRGTAVVLVCPADSMESIPNPFLQQEAN